MIWRWLKLNGVENEDGSVTILEFSFSAGVEDQAIHPS
jgi:hypothetical protein